MLIYRPLILTLFFIFFLWPGDIFAQSNETISFQAPDSWVVQNTIDIPDDTPLDDIDNGVYYIHMDNQVNVATHQKTRYFSRYVKRIVNQEGLEAASQINLSYDPLYEDIILHSLIIHRGETRIDKSASARISTLQRESDLEEQLYNGRLTTNIIIDDIRVGDVLEYSFTFIGSNPVYQDLFSYSRYTQWDVPVHTQYLRVLWGKSNPLYLKTLNTDLNVTEKSYGTSREYTFLLNDTPPMRINTEIPKWYYPYSQIYFYETQSWSDIAKWADTLYDNVIDSTDETEQIAADINRTFHDPKEQTAAALKYVQSNIRYLGIEMGTNSHMPSPPDETLSRRYGDCKDKTVLFISILKALNIEAFPVLVGTDIKDYIAKLPPVANVFDHVIVKVVIDGKTYWLDPTRSYQTGKLDNIFQPDYGYGLVVDKKTDALESMSNANNLSKKTVKDFFDLQAGPEHNATFRCVSEHQGYFAEKLLYKIASMGMTNLQKKYVDFYSDFYPGIEVSGRFEKTDDAQTGAVTQEENYLIQKFWKYDEKKQEYVATFYADSIAPYLSKPAQVNRNSPYAFSHPYEIEHTIQARLDDINWSLPNKETILDNAFFYLRSNTDYESSSRTLTLTFAYRSKTDHIPADKIDTYLEEREKALDLLEYGIVQYPDDTKSSADPKESLQKENEEDDTESIGALIAILLFISGLIYAVVSWRLDARKEPVFEDVFFYPVSILKLLILSTVSFGLYTAYWFYRNYRYQKIKEQSAIMPIVRGIFFTLWYYPLYTNLYDDSMQRYDENRVLLKPLAVLFAIFFFLANLFAYEDEMIALLSFAMPLFLIPLANYINYINGEASEAYRYNSRWRVRHTVLTLLATPLILMSIADELHIIPSAKVVRGESLMHNDIRYMQRKNVFPSDETIQYFYSDAILSVRDDGNGFTENHVFSYWKEDGKLQVQKAAFSDIKRINVTYNEESILRTTITIVRKDGSSFPLYVSSEASLDKVFIKQLNAQWDSQRKK